MMRAIVARLRGNEAGLSMVEILVSSMLTLIVLIMVGTMFVQTSRLTTAASQARDSTGAASNVMNRVSSVVRVSTTLAVANTTPAPAIVDGSNRSLLKVYSLADTSATAPAPVMMTFALDTSTNTVTETRCVGTTANGYWSFTTCASTSSRDLGSGLMPPTGTSDQMFTYRDANKQPILLGNGGTDNLTLAQRAAVASIVVTVRAQSATGARIVTLRNTVVLRNLGLDPTP